MISGFSLYRDLQIGVLGPTVTFHIINKEYNKCKRISSEKPGWQEVNTIWYLTGWWRLSLASFFSSNCTMEGWFWLSAFCRGYVETKNIKSRVIRITYHLLITKENILTTGTVNDVINAYFQIRASYLINASSVLLNLYYTLLCNKHPLFNRCPLWEWLQILGISKKV